MAKKEKKVSISAFENTMKSEFNNKITVDWHGIEIDILRNISLVSAVEFVNEVVNACVENNAMFEIKDLLIKKNIIERYTNISVSDKLAKMCDIIYGCDIVDFVMSHINPEQISDITVAINNKIAYRLNSNIRNIEKSVDEVVYRTNDMMSQFENAFGEVNIEDIKKIAGALNLDEITEESIVKSIINAKKSGDIK